MASPSPLPSARPAPPAAGLFSAFRAGLVEPSPLALFGAVAVAAALLLLCARTLDEGIVARGVFAAFPGDDFAFLAAESVTLQHARAEAPVEVALLASSAGREALETHASLTGALQQATGHRVPVRLLMAGALLHLEMLAIVDRLPRDRRWLVGVEISQRNLGLPPEEAQHLLDHPRLPLRSALQEQAAAAVGLRPRERDAANYFLDQAPFFLARPQGLLHLLTGAPSPHFHQVDGMPEPGPADWARMEARVAGWIARWAEDTARNEPLYAALVEAVRARGGDVVFIEALRNPDVVKAATADPAVAAARERYHAHVREFASSLGVEHWSLDAEAQLGAGDFLDYAHLGPGDGRARYTRALAGRLARHLRAP